MHTSSRKAHWPRLTALLLVGVLPSLANADWFGLRNDTPSALVIQQSCVVNNKAYPARPLLLYPGEMIWDSVMQRGERSIAIYDPRQPQRALYQNKVSCGGQDLLYSVRPGPVGQVKFEKANLPLAQKPAR